MGCLLNIVTFYYFNNTNNYTLNKINFINFSNQIDEFVYNNEYKSLFLKVKGEIYAVKYQDYWNNRIVENEKVELWNNKNCKINNNSRAIFCIEKDDQNTVESFLQIYENTELVF